MNLSPEVLAYIQSQLQKQGAKNPMSFNPQEYDESIGLNGDVISGVSQPNTNYSPYSTAPPTQTELEKQSMEMLKSKNEGYMNNNIDEIRANQSQYGAYNKMQMEDYLNNRAFGTGSQITGTMPYYADRMGRGIQKGGIVGGLQAAGGGLGMLFQGFKGVMAGVGSQKTEDFMKSEGQRKLRDYMKSGKGRESLYNNYAMGNYGNFAEGGEVPMEEQAPTQQEVPQEQSAPMPQGEEILFAYFEANQFNEQQAQEFMATFQQLSPEEQQGAIQEIAASLSPQQNEQPEQEEKEEKPTILDGKTMSESTKVVRKGNKDFLQIIKETPISKKEAKDFREFM